MKLIAVEFEIIDLHTHPFLSQCTNICSHKEYCNRSNENNKKDLMNLGIVKIGGSVIGKPKGDGENDSVWEKIKACNNKVLNIYISNGLQV